MKKDLLNTPLSELSAEEKTAAVHARDALDAKNYAENKRYKPLSAGVPHIISDHFASGDLYSHADGKTYDSKSAYKKAVKAAGYEICGEGIKPQKPKESEINWNGAVAETLERMGH